MPKGIFVHIGTHKTGTTSIQAFLRENADALRQSGLYVPTTGTTGPISGHHNIGWQVRNDPRFKRSQGTLDDLLSELDRSASQRAVISSEDLEYLVQFPRRLEGLEDALLGAGWHPLYVVFFRRPDEYALSLYGELLKHGLSIGFERFVSQILGDGCFTMRGDWCFHFDYEDFARKWRHAARGELRILSYDRAVTGNGLIPAFLSAIGLPGDPGAAAHERLNARMRASHLLERETAERLRRRFPMLAA